jgi:hypothetical protein
MMNEKSRCGVSYSGEWIFRDHREWPATDMSLVFVSGLNGNGIDLIVSISSMYMLSGVPFYHEKDRRSSSGLTNFSPQIAFYADLKRSHNSHSVSK